MAAKKFSIQIAEAAIGDIEIARSFYEERKMGLGIRFVKEVKTTISRLENHPFFEIRYRNIRCAPVSKFPFLVHFSVDEPSRKVEVFAIVHTSRNPESYL